MYEYEVKNRNAEDNTHQCVGDLRDGIESNNRNLYSYTVLYIIQYYIVMYNKLTK